ncbi:ESPR-type extended signal peptide-containing protein, partial [Parasutterella excrementihominis]
MNKAFRTIWNDVRQSFVTTSEIQTSLQSHQQWRSVPLSPHPR